MTTAEVHEDAAVPRARARRSPADEEVVIVGAGQAGLAVSHELTRAGVAHVVLDRGRVGESWRGRWESFCAVTPNWYLSLPGRPYAGPDPDGFMPRDAIVAHLERYAEAFAAPVRSGVEVTGLVRAPGTGFRLETSDGPIAARAVVLGTGAFPRQHRPPAAATLPAGVLRLDLAAYRDPGDLPAGAVLVVGSGQSGCQVADELLRAGRDVLLSCGRAPWAARRVGGRDIVWWLHETGFLDAPLSSLPTPAARLAANVQLTGAGVDRDLHYRTLRAEGVTLLGRFLGVEGRRARFATDLAASVAWGDERRGQLMDLIRGLAAERGLPAPEIPPPPPFAGDAPTEVDLRGVGTVVFTSGFRPDYSWVRIPGALDELGFPVQRDGASTAAPGLFFIGVHFLRTRRSSSFAGAGEDAPVVARQIVARHAARA
ncbi:MAG: putative flavoprotein involved in transport [Miltoncostaeaceae bacterium]|nr:putative flavoprotein involved in transport [Miltoncostaeaceae bacterium]